MDVLLKSFIKDPSKTHYDGEDENERTLYIIRRTLLTNVGWFLTSIVIGLVPAFIIPYFITNAPEFSGIITTKFILILTLFFYLLAVGYFFQNFLNWFYNVYIITNKKIIDMDFHGILYKNISEAPLRNIEDVTSNVRGTLNVIFNYGDVYIQTAAERREFEFVNVSNPSKIRDIISDLVSLKRHGKDD